MLEERYTQQQIVLKKLLEKKDLIEHELCQITSFLLSPEGHGITGSLVDSEGFPISGADLVTIRVQRNRYACLQNDHKACMKEIELALTELHAIVNQCKKAGIPLQPVSLQTLPNVPNPSTRKDGSFPLNGSDGDDSFELPFDKMRRQLQDAGPVTQTFKLVQTVPPSSTIHPSPADFTSASIQSVQSLPCRQVESVSNTLLEMADPALKQFCSSLAPFAIITNVAEGSPAWSAGLRQDDALLSFHSLFLPTEKPSSVRGDIDYELWSEMESQRLIKEVSQIVIRHKNTPVRLTVLRQGVAPDGSTTFLQIIIRVTPQEWAGRGLLGCQLDPL